MVLFYNIYNLTSCCIELICTVPSPCDCDFEEDFCEWVQDTSDDFDWTKSTGATSFQNTAPAFDHTFGNGEFFAHSP